MGRGQVKWRGGDLAGDLVCSRRVACGMHDCTSGLLQSYYEPSNCLSLRRLLVGAAVINSKRATQFGDGSIC